MPTRTTKKKPKTSKTKRPAAKSHLRMGKPKTVQIGRARRKPSGARAKTEVAEIAIDKLQPAPYNPRVALKPGDSEYTKILRSIEAFGYSSLLTWNRTTGHVVGGHQRLQVLRDLGWKKVKVSVVRFTLAKEKALNLALNQISGEFDSAKLSVLLSELQADDSIDESLTGFDADELAAAIAETTASNKKTVEFETTPKSKWEVVVECKGENDQRQTYEILTGEGHTCRVVTK